MAKRTVRQQEPLPLVQQDAGEVMFTIAGIPDDSEVVIYLYRIPEAGRSRYLMKMEKSVFDLETVKQKFGGGRFKYVLAEGNINTFQASFEIEGEPVIEARFHHENKHLPNQPAPQTAAERFARLEKMIEDMRKEKFAAPSPAPNPLEGVMNQLLTLVLQRAIGSSDDLEKKILERFGMYKDILKEQDSPKFQADMIQSLVLKGMELAEQSGGSKSENTVHLLIEKFGPAVRDLAVAVAQALSGAGGTRPRKVVNPNDPLAGQPDWVREAPLAPGETPTMKPEAPTQSPPAPPSHPAMQFATPGFEKIAPMLQAYLPAIFASAANNIDPAKWADLILDNIPDGSEAMLIGWLQSDAWMRDLVTLDPRIEGQYSWWADLRRMLLSDLMTSTDEGNGSNLRDVDDDAQL